LFEFDEFNSKNIDDCLNQFKQLKVISLQDCKRVKILSKEKIGKSIFKEHDMIERQSQKNGTNNMWEIKLYWIEK